MQQLLPLSSFIAYTFTSSHHILSYYIIQNNSKCFILPLFLSSMEKQLKTNWFFPKYIRKDTQYLMVFSCFWLFASIRKTEFKNAKKIIAQADGWSKQYNNFLYIYLHIHIGGTFVTHRDAGRQRGYVRLFVDVNSVAVEVSKQRNYIVYTNVCCHIYYMTCANSVYDNHNTTLTHCICTNREDVYVCVFSA